MSCFDIENIENPLVFSVINGFGRFGESSAFWKHLGRILETSWSVLEASWSVLEASWRRLGGVLKRLGGVLERLGGVLERLGAVLEPS